MFKKLNDVYIYKINDKESSYPNAPFSPNEIYPELNNLDYKVETDKENEVYSAVRSILYNLGFDHENYGKENWNPLRELVKPGQKVLIKPNFVKGEHPLGEIGVLSMITHASLMRPIIDYLLLATNGNVEIIIGDVPLQYSKWEQIIDISGTKKLVEFYEKKGIKIKLMDLRKEIAICNKENIIYKKILNPDRDESMYTAVDLKQKSELMEIIKYFHRLEITDYGYGTVPKHHNKNKNEYLIPNEVLEADVFINMPKLKTHRKAGLTCAMKNLIGINGDKSWIAHHRRGFKWQGGDEFKDFHLPTFLKVRIWNFLKTFNLGVKLASLLKKVYKKFVWRGKTYEEVSMEGNNKYYFEGSWSGNDTLWRCIKDLNKILLYSDKYGDMHEEKQRKYLCIVDAILAGEREGPMEHTPKKCNLVFGGLNPVYVDYIASEIMGFDYKFIPSIYKSFDNKWWDLVEKSPNEVKYDSNVLEKEWKYRFIPTSGWKSVLMINKEDI